MKSLREELVQTAAVCVAIIEQIDGGVADSTKDHMWTALGAVRLERGLQDHKWGPQNHSIAEWLVILGEEYGEACKAALEETIFPKGESDGER